MKYCFPASIERLPGKIKWSVIYFPHAAGDHFGTRGRVHVKARVDGHLFGATLLPSRLGHYLVYNAAMKAAVGKAVGDRVRVELEAAGKPAVSVPDDVAAALRGAGMLERFEALPDYMRREAVNHIVGAKRGETKTARMEALLARLAARKG